MASNSRIQTSPSPGDLLRLLTYVRRYTGRLVVAYTALLVLLATQLAAPELIRRIIDEGIGRSNRGFIVYGGLGLVGLALARALFTFVQSYLSEVVSQGVAFDLRNALFDKIQQLSFTYHDRAQTGELMTRATSDVDQVRDFIGSGLLQLINSVILLAGTAVILIVLNVRLAAVTLAANLVMIAVIMRFSGQVRPMFKLIQEERGKLNSVLQENLVGVRVVKAFTREDHESRRFGIQNQTLLDRTLELFRLFATSLPMFITISSLGLLAVIWYGGSLVMQGVLTLGELVAFNTYLLMLMMPVRMIGFLIGMAARASASTRRIMEVLEAPVEIADRPGAVELPPIRGEVRFDRVSFSYAGGGDTLHEVDFEARPGQVVALLGMTGSGKTTIINLIPRFYDASAGRVMIDGYDVRDVQVESLRRQIGLVLQETTLFGGTIRDNIAYGCPDATDERVRAVAEAAEAHGFISSLQNGYDTAVGERGVTLSGGQRQRVAIARALLLDPRILILDDSTSSVDVETEYQIQRALKRLMKGRTSFVIAQRLSTVRKADLILVLDRGQIVARGKHDELLEMSPLYAELYHLQLGVSEPDTKAIAGRGQPAWGGASMLEGRWS